MSLSEKTNERGKRGASIAEEVATVKAHVHSTVEHDVFASDGDEDAAPSDVLPGAKGHNLDGHACLVLVLVLVQVLLWCFCCVAVETVASGQQQGERVLKRLQAYPAVGGLLPARTKFKFKKRDSAWQTSFSFSPLFLHPVCTHAAHSVCHQHHSLPCSQPVVLAHHPVAHRHTHPLAASFFNTLLRRISF